MLRAQVDQCDVALRKPGGQRFRVDGRQGGSGRRNGGGERQPAREPAFEHACVVPHLPQPARDSRRAHAVVVEQHEPRAAHADVLVAGLHQLPAGRVLRARQAAGREFFGRAHVAEEQAAACVAGPLLHGLCRDRGHVEALGQCLGGGPQIGVAAVAA
jgi:hypothetical protein